MAQGPAYWNSNFAYPVAPGLFLSEQHPREVLACYVYIISFGGQLRYKFVGDDLPWNTSVAVLLNGDQAARKLQWYRLGF